MRERHSLVLQVAQAWIETCIPTAPSDQGAVIQTLVSFKLG
jgi:hypothetical protein